MLDFKPNSGSLPAPAQPHLAPRAPQRLDFAENDELGLITRELAEKLDAPTALLAVWNTKQKRLRTICAYGGPQYEELRALPVRQSGFVGRVLVSGRTLAEPIATEQDPHLGPRGGRCVTHAAGAAVRPPHGPRGALCVGLSAKPRDLRAALWLVESYARMAALCLRGGTAPEGVLSAARQDALTGCLNYLAIRSELAREVARSARHTRPLSVSFIHLDGFKQIDHHHGHPQGSGVLAEVATILRGDVRGGDSVGRYGGDEFIIVQPDTDEAAARALAERLRARLSTTTVTAADQPLNASIGVAEREAGMTADELLAAADRALRWAKKLGGGTVVGANDIATGASRGVGGHGPGADDVVTGASRGAGGPGPGGGDVATGASRGVAGAWAGRRDGAVRALPPEA